MKNTLAQIAFTTAFLFVVLFDKDSLQLGTSLLEVPEWVITTASIFGNVFWLFGLVVIIVGGLLIWIAMDDEVLDKTYNQLKEKSKLKELEKTRPVGKAISIFVAIFAVGSGFWFTGSSILFFHISFYIYRSAIITRWERDEDAPPRNKKLATNGLLDD